MSQPAEALQQPLPIQLDLSLLLLKVPVSDVIRAVSFYRDVLGFEEQFTVPEYGWAQLQVSGRTSGSVAESPLVIALYVPGMGGGDRSVGGGVDFHLGLPDLATLCRRWEFSSQSLGESVVGGMISGIITGADGTRSLEVTDPDGNVLKVIEVEAEAPETKSAQDAE